MQKPSSQIKLNLLVNGFQPHERRIIEATAKFSQSRNLCLVLISELEIERAEVIIVDGNDHQALTWAAQHEAQLAQKTVIWVDAPAHNPRHKTITQPVLWVNLPITISRILDDIGMEENIRQTKSTQPASVASPTRSINHAHILVVDDSQAVRSYLTSFLKHQGYVVTAVESGEEAIDAVKSEPYDCVLMDVLMPGMDGYKACREVLKIKHGQKHTSVVMLTSKTSPFDKIRGKMAGCSAYLTKPVTKDKLLETVEHYVHAK